MTNLGYKKKTRWIHHRVSLCYELAVSIVQLYGIKLSPRVFVHVAAEFLTNTPSEDVETFWTQLLVYGYEPDTIGDDVNMALR